MYIRQRGSMLIVVLLLLQVISLLGIYVFEMSALEAKMANAAWQRSQMFYLSEAALRDVEKKIMQNLSACLIPTISSHVLFSRPLSWWQSPATCTGNFQAMQYYYTVEMLGEDPCGYVDSQTLVKYYRISLLSISKQKDAMIRLQSTLTLPTAGSISDCSKTKHNVTLGRQMWREYIK